MTVLDQVTSQVMQTAVSEEGLSIPLIDFSHFLQGTPEQKKKCAEEIISGFTNAGFIYLKNHGIPEDHVKTMFENSTEFFKLPQETKESLAWYSARANRGYSTFGREKASRLTSKTDIDDLRLKSPDLKESLEIGRSDQPQYPNLWPPPSVLPNFKPQMEEMFQVNQKLHIEIMRAIAIGLKLDDEKWFDRYCSSADNNMRLLHYPSVKKENLGTGEEERGAVRAGAHSDYGTITLLFQDQAGGLQVRAPNGTYVDATPIPGTIVVNAGDLLARWSNDLINSTEHRVVRPPGEGVKRVNEESGEEEVWYPARYSCVYFCNPNYHDFIEAIPGTYGGEKGEKKYPGVTGEDYMVSRLASTYGST
ncbi:hypothetical protein DFH27DRAFT_192558 [Peziza echinospora]|nr:hypothetical protein DFH27DRAFT_192558 [Peziza echinospora]